MLQFTDRTFVVGGMHCSMAFLLAMEEFHYSRAVWTYFVKSMEVLGKKKLPLWGGIKWKFCR